MSTVQATTTNTLKAFATGASQEQRETMQKRIRELVGEVFFGTMLKQMRSEVDSSNPLNGGKAGQTYARQLDQVLISKLAGSTNFEIGQKIAEAWTGKFKAETSTNTALPGPDAVKSKYTQLTSQERYAWQ